MELKKIFKSSLICLLVAAPAASFAAQSTCPTCSFSGFTVGLGIGASTLMTSTASNTTVDSAIEIEPGRVTQVFPVPGNVYGASGSNSLYKFEAMGALFAGYGFVFDQYNHTYLGAELGVNGFSSTHTTLNISNSTAASMSGDSDDLDTTSVGTYNNVLSTKTVVTRKSYEPFLDLKAGFLLTPDTLVYFKGGFNINTLEIKTSGSYSASGSQTSTIDDDSISSAASATSGFSMKKNRSRVGYRAGAGIEIMVTPTIGVGGDYIYSFYQKVKTSGSAAGSDVSCDVLGGCSTVAATFSSSSKASRFSDQELVGQMIYHFG